MLQILQNIKTGELKLEEVPAPQCAPGNLLVKSHASLISAGTEKMLIELAVLFLILALVAYILGARGIAGFSMDNARWLVIIFVIIAIVAFIL